VGTRSNERPRGITRDGLFRINMGLAGVHTPPLLAVAAAVVVAAAAATVVVVAAPETS
jgi:hypothetical protein